MSEKDKQSAEVQLDALMRLHGADITNTAVLGELIRKLRDKGLLTDGDIGSLLQTAETRACSSAKLSPILVQYIRQGVRLFRGLMAASPPAGGGAVH